jgi:hypothetical protein
MAINFSDYGNGDLIPADTIAPVQIRITYGDGTDGVLTPTKGKDAEALKAELTVLEGEYAKRKLFAFWIVTGTTAGQKSIAAKNCALLKNIIASALYLDPNDRSPETLTKYQKEWRDFDGLKFLAKIGIEPGRDGYEDKNVVARAITRDSPQWGGRPPFGQGPTGGGNGPVGGGGGSSPATPIVKPPWAS